MTNEEAMAILTNHTQYKCSGEDLVAIDVAIKVLEQEPCEDCISRQAVIDMAGLSEWFDSSDSYNEFVIVLSKLPSVTPKTKIGHWIAQDIHNCHTDFRCSECGYIHSFMHLYGKPTADYIYCPNCGAKMEIQG